MRVFIHFTGNRDVTDAIRSPPISILTAKIAQIPQVRAAVVNSLRTRADNCKEGVVIEGRDTGALSDSENHSSIVIPITCVRIGSIPRCRGKSISGCLSGGESTPSAETNRSV